MDNEIGLASYRKELRGEMCRGVYSMFTSDWNFLVDNEYLSWVGGLVSDEREYVVMDLSMSGGRVDNFFDVVDRPMLRVEALVFPSIEDGDRYIRLLRAYENSLVGNKC